MRTSGIGGGPVDVVTVEKKDRKKPSGSSGAGILGWIGGTQPKKSGKK